MIRATPDTNVLVSAFFYDGNERAILEAGIRGRLRLILSLELLRELIQVLDEKFHVDSEMRWAYVVRLSEVSEIVSPMRLSDVTIRDRGDVKVIECGQTGHSQYIVTGDRDLLSLKNYKGIKMVTAGRLLKILRLSRP